MEGTVQGQERVVGRQRGCGVGNAGVASSCYACSLSLVLKTSQLPEDLRTPRGGPGELSRGSACLLRWSSLWPSVFHSHLFFSPPREFQVVYLFIPFSYFSSHQTLFLVAVTR